MDIVKYALALLLVAAGVFAFYWFNGQWPSVARVMSVIGGLVAGALLFMTTVKGAETREFLSDAYEQVGLSAEHIELLTGQPHERVLAELRAATIPVRPVTTFSPWFLRQSQPRSAPAGPGFVRKHQNNT